MCVCVCACACMCEICQARHTPHHMQLCAKFALVFIAHLYVHIFINMFIDMHRCTNILAHKMCRVCVCMRMLLVELLVHFVLLQSKWLNRKLTYKTTQG